MDNIKEYIKNNMKYIIKHLDECKKNHCPTCNRLYIKLDIYEDLLNEIEKNGKTK